MGKVICEICGTSYSDTANECPVCGCEKPETADFVEQDDFDFISPVQETGSYVKGGRFSKSNVNKRAKSGGAAKRTAAPGKSGRRKKAGSKADTFLVVAIIVLLIAIIGVLCYIYFHYFAPFGGSGNTKPVETTTEPVSQTQPSTQPSTTVTTAPVDLSCTGLKLTEGPVVLKQKGDTWLLNAIPTPANTTDTITYQSADPNVATVAADGTVTAVGDGETVIVITCGDVSIECKVICELAPETTEPEETEPEQTDPDETEPEETEPADVGEFELSEADITFDAKGQTCKLYDGDIDVTKIIWTVGNSSVATVKNGVVKAVGPGITHVYAEYNGVKLSCIIRCVF